jgi:hypothetical protein
MSRRRRIAGHLTAGDEDADGPAPVDVSSRARHVVDEEVDGAGRGARTRRDLRRRDDPILAVPSECLGERFGPFQVERGDDSPLSKDVTQRSLFRSGPSSSGLSPTAITGRRPPGTSRQQTMAFFDSPGLSTTSAFWSVRSSYFAAGSSGAEMPRASRPGRERRRPFRMGVDSSRETSDTSQVRSIVPRSSRGGNPAIGHPSRPSLDPRRPFSQAGLSPAKRRGGSAERPGGARSNPSQVARHNPLSSVRFGLTSRCCVRRIAPRVERVVSP